MLYKAFLPILYIIVYILPFVKVLVSEEQQMPEVLEIDAA